ncbi:hypothetical protein Pelo_4084 [Pelomyxa schiedti]|nr:hypothetical protein Pelo_4084 [Pelomyxa schiedti]
MEVTTKVTLDPTTASDSSATCGALLVNFEKMFIGASDWLLHDSLKENSIGTWALTLRNLGTQTQSVVEDSGITFLHAAMLALT